MDSESDELLLRPKTTRDKDLEISLQDYSREKIEELCKTSSDLTADKVLETWIRELMKFKELRSTEDGDLRNSGYRNSAVTRDSAYSSDVDAALRSPHNRQSTDLFRFSYPIIAQRKSAEKSPYDEDNEAYSCETRDTTLLDVQEENHKPNLNVLDSPEDIISGCLSQTECCKEKNEEFMKQTECLKEKNENFVKQTGCWKEKIEELVNQTECWKEKNEEFMKQPLRKSSSAFFLSYKETELENVEEEGKPLDSFGEDAKSSSSLSTAAAAAADKTIESSHSQRKWQSSRSSF